MTNLFRPPESYLAECETCAVRIYAIPEQEFKPRERRTLVVDTDVIASGKCPGPRFRIETITLPSSAGYRFAIGIVTDDELAQVKIAKTFPIHGASLSEAAVPIHFNITVKRKFEIFVRRQAIRPHYRFIGEKCDPAKHLLVHALRPEVKEPPTAKLTGSIRILLAPANGWN